MLQKVEARNAAGAILILLLEDESNGFAIRDIQGLDPVKATIASSSFAQQDGAQYHSSRRETRNIVLTLDLYPDYIDTQVKDLRNVLYSFFMPKTNVNLRFYDDNGGPTVDIVGYTESCECPLFTNNPKASISILCMDPDFMDLSDDVISGNTTATTTETLVTYDGTVDTGIVFVLNVDRTLTEFTIYHRPPDGVLRSLDFSANLELGDIVTISTVRGSKYATLTRAGSTSSLLYAVSPQSNWIELQNGDNNIRIYAIGAGIPYTITYTNRYGGL